MGTSQTLDDTLSRIDKSTGFTANRKRDLRSHARALSTVVVAQVAREEKGRPKPLPDSTFTVALREAFQRSSKTRVEICRAAGLSQAVFGEWLRGRQPRSPNLNRGSLKILVSAVQFRPWPPEFTNLSARVLTIRRRNPN